MLQKDFKFYKEDYIFDKKGIDKESRDGIIKFNISISLDNSNFVMLFAFSCPSFLIQSRETIDNRNTHAPARGCPVFQNGGL